MSTEFDMEQRLAAIGARLTKWHEDVDQATQQAWNRQRDPESMKLARDTAISKVGPDPTEELYALLDEMSAAYLESTTDQRARYRAMLGGNRTVLFEMYDYMRRNGKFLEETKNPRWLRLGLAAASLEDGRVDYRDLLTALANLYVASEHAGIDPRPYFQSISEISNSVERPSRTRSRHPFLRQIARPIVGLKELVFGNESTAAMLANFHKFEVYRREVRPRL